jgi:hypothetical protein
MKMDAQRLDGHKKVLGILYIISSAFTVLGMLLLNVFLSLIFSFIFEEVNQEEQAIIEFVMAIVAYLPWAIILFIALPTFIAGIGLLTRQGWSVILSVIVGCIKLFSFPIGTAMGVYAIWIFSEDQKLSRASASN